MINYYVTTQHTSNASRLVFRVFYQRSKTTLATPRRAC
nr:MAG TPA: hypothetical protein [Caudoviricetes sp.]